jgi:hypothetical protein
MRVIKRRSAPGFLFFVSSTWAWAALSLSMLLMLDVSLLWLSPRHGAAWEFPQQIYGSVWSPTRSPVDVAHARWWSGQELGWQTDLVKNAIGAAPTNEQTLPTVALRPREVARMRSSTENRENCRVIPTGLRSKERGCSWPPLNDPGLPDDVHGHSSWSTARWCVSDAMYGSLRPCRQTTIHHSMIKFSSCIPRARSARSGEK